MGFGSIRNDKKKRMKISFIINMAISILTLNIILMTIFGIRVIYGYEPSFLVAGVPIYSYFTTQSNVFMGIVSFIFANREYLVLKGKKKEVPRNIYILKMVATASVSLTFFIVFAFLGFVVNGGHASLLNDNNLFFHLIIPVISIMNFIFLEKTDTIKFKHVFLGLLPIILYEIYYSLNVFIHYKNGVVNPSTDPYFFFKKGSLTPFIAPPAMLAVTFLLTFIIWKINKKSIKT